MLAADREACALAVALHHDAHFVWPHRQCHEVQNSSEGQHCKGLRHHCCRLVLDAVLCPCLSQRFWLSVLPSLHKSDPSKLLRKLKQTVVS